MCCRDCLDTSGDFVPRPCRGEDEGEADQESGSLSPEELSDDPVTIYIDKRWFALLDIESSPPAEIIAPAHDPRNAIFDTASVSSTAWECIVAQARHHGDHDTLSLEALWRAVGSPVDHDPMSWLVWAYPLVMTCETYFAVLRSAGLSVMHDDGRSTLYIRGNGGEDWDRGEDWDGGNDGDAGDDANDRDDGDTGNDANDGDDGDDGDDEFLRPGDLMTINLYVAEAYACYLDFLPRGGAS